MLKKFLFPFFIFQFVVCALPAQNKTVDSLLTLLQNDKPDTNKVIHLNKLSWEYINIGDYTVALQYGNVALQLAEQLNFRKAIATAYNNIGVVYYHQGNYDKALENHLASLKLQWMPPWFYSEQRAQKA